MTSNFTSMFRIACKNPKNYDYIPARFLDGQERILSRSIGGIQRDQSFADNGVLTKTVRRINNIQITTEGNNVKIDMSSKKSLPRDVNPVQERICRNLIELRNFIKSVAKYIY